MANIKKEEQVSSEIGILLEAARRANWAALHGPPHLRTGRFRLSSNEPSRVIQNVVRKGCLGSFSEVEENLAYWRSKTPECRVEAVELLRRQQNGSAARLQRSARVVCCASG